ncbi:ABC transporter permease [Amycolatopsis sp. H20-H5]|uniref:ABC transporter permease n=1 Tax=Amycolatopsis sp. H20-H5 TaxID=3046309 RepID=UPI002DBB704D|nr:ABC transporter permease [Amycolatopsis sp. H20-H5]MEC3980780.1 ABC transporter permease [Amycolatopsis sp. H20-H5]
MAAPDRRPAGALALVAVAAGALVAVLLGFLTFGAQATVAPDHVPVAVSAPDGPLLAMAEKVAGHGGGQLDWQVKSIVDGRKLLADKKVYGILELGAGPSATVVVSGAVNPSGTQVAQQALIGAAQALVGVPKIETVHPASAAGRTAPLAVSALGWVGCLAASAVLTLLAARSGRKPGVAARLTQVAGAGVLLTAVLAGFLKLWDSSLPLGWDVLGFLLLVTTGFAAAQAGLLRLLGVRAMAVLGPLYLVAPAVAGQVPELLNPAYRTLLWSWTPFRFSTEGLRSLLQGVPSAPDVATGVWVLSALLVAGLAVVLWPASSAGQEAEAHTPDGVVEVGVH